MKQSLTLLAVLFSATSFAQNVGIGTLTPTDQLHTTGSVRLQKYAGATTRLLQIDSSGRLTATAAGAVFTNTTAYAITDNGCPTGVGITSSITISGQPNVPIQSSRIAVKVNITHPYVGDLKIYLFVSTAIHVLTLANGNGGSGDNFTNTIFTDQAPSSISTGAAPFTGQYKPSGGVAVCNIPNPAVNDFASIGFGDILPNGTWTLKVFDAVGSDVGVLNDWSISFTGAESITTADENNFIPKLVGGNFKASNIYQPAGSLNIGIGTNNPTAKLDVNGTVKITDGNQGDGKILTSDSVGNATWQEAKASNGSVGFGTWGDCSTNNISEYLPIADTTNQTNFSFFGNEVAISGNYAIVGAPSDKIGANLDQGSANIYKFNNGVWTLTQKIVDANGLANDEFGTSVAISGNYAFVGARFKKVGANDYQGSVNVYVLNGGNWVFSQQLTDPSGVAGSYFGSSVAISGNYLIVGAPSGGSLKGNACIYQLLLGSFIFMQKITDATGIVGDAFGKTVSISGNNIIVGSPGFGFSDNGAVNIYKLSGSWVLVNKFTSNITGDKYGVRVSIADNTAIVGVSEATNTVSNQTYYGVGAVFTYHLVNNSWIRGNNLPSSAPTVSTKFGRNLFLSGNYAIINYPENNSSKVTIFQRIGFTWQKVQDIPNPLPSQQNIFGFGVSIDASTKRFLISSVCNYSIATCNGFAIFGKLNF